MVKEGFLDKRGEWNSSWKTRYFVLDSSHELKYFSKETDKDSPDKVKGYITLFRAPVVEGIPEKGRFIIQIDGSNHGLKRRVFILGTKSQEEHANWMKHLLAATQATVLTVERPPKTVRKDPVIPARWMRRAMAELDPKERKTTEIGAGQIWDFWGSKANAFLAGGAGGAADAMDGVIDFLQGPPALNRQEEAARLRRQLERQEERELAARGRRRRSRCGRTRLSRSTTSAR